jgi:hypothetical protein
MSLLKNQGHPRVSLCFASSVGLRGIFVDALFATKRDQRVHFCCTPCGNPTGKQCNQNQNSGDNRKGDRVGRANTVQDRPHQARCCD